MKPGKIEVPAPAIGVIHEQKAKEIRIPYKLQPSHAALGSMLRLSNLFSLLERYTLLFAGRVAEPPVPGRTPENAQRAKNKKRRAPSVALLDGNHDRRRERSAHGGRRPKHTQRASPFGSRKPA